MNAAYVRILFLSVALRKVRAPAVVRDVHPDLICCLICLQRRRAPTRLSLQLFAAVSRVTSSFVECVDDVVNIWISRLAGDKEKKIP